MKRVQASWRRWPILIIFFIFCTNVSFQVGLKQRIQRPVQSGRSGALTQSGQIKLDGFDLYNRRLYRCLVSNNFGPFTWNPQWIIHWTVLFRLDQLIDMTSVLSTATNIRARLKIFWRHRKCYNLDFHSGSYLSISTRASGIVCRKSDVASKIYFHWHWVEFSRLNYKKCGISTNLILAPLCRQHHFAAIMGFYGK